MQPRFHHQWRPEQLFVEKTLDAKLVESMKGFGHTVESLESAGVSQAIAQLPDGTFVGVFAWELVA